MGSSILTEHSELSRTWARLSVVSFDNPEAHLTRLWELAERDNWSVSDMNWNSVDLSTMPSDLRERAANMFTQLHYGELTALLCAARLVQHAPNLSAQLFSSTQVNDEARHVRWFSRLMQNIGYGGKVRDTVAEFMTDVYECESIDGMIIGMHILVEGMAHSFFMEGSKFFRKPGSFAKFSKTYRSAQKVLGEWLPNYLGRDESRHIAYGVQFLQKRLPELTAAQRSALEDQVNRWGQMFVSAALDPDLVLMPGMDGYQVADRCIRNLNQRLMSIGMEARIPTIEKIDCLSDDVSIWTIPDSN